MQMLGFFIFGDTLPMTHATRDPALPWLLDGQDFPPPHSAWGEATSAPGLLAAGGSLDVASLCKAYRQGIFPWFSRDQPPLWWSTDPRMVLKVHDFRLTTSLRKQIRSLLKQKRLVVHMDRCFPLVITQCATSPRAGQSGTWIVPEMVRAYQLLHEAGFAHSVETWLDGKLVGGLYAVNMGRMVFGESMFSHVSNASKIALCALVGFCRHEAMPMIDCQQQTPHLASLGAKPVERSTFLIEVSALTSHPSPLWQFEAKHWDTVLG